MERHGPVLAGIALIFVIGLTALYFYTRDTTTPPDGQGATTTPSEQSGIIEISAPRSGDTISSPVRVTGRARGNWYFEASFPVKIIDANGNQLGITPVQAQGDWMTTEHVPFDTTVSFATSTTQDGFIVFEKDNPSGLPEHADERRIPIRFAQVNAQTRTVQLYYYNPGIDKDASGNVLCSRNGLVAVSRTTARTNTPLADTIRLLLAGELTAAERAQGITTEFPLSGFRLTGAAIQNNIATLTFADPQNRTIGGSCRVTVLWAQIDATAKQFSGVNSVQFKPDDLFQP